MNKKYSAVTILLVILMIFMAACGSSGSGSGTNTGSAGGSTAASPSPSDQSEKKVKIAIVGPLSGTWAHHGQNSVKGPEIAIEEINASGGIKSLGGAKLELISADSGSGDPSHAASVVRRVLQENPDLVAVLGLFLSSHTVAASTVTEQEKIPMLTKSFTDEITSRGYKYIFQFPAKASVMGSASVEYLLDMSKSAGKPIENVAIVSDNASSNKTTAEATAKGFRDKGVKVSVEEYFQPGLTDASSLATKIIAQNPDLVYAGGSLSDVSLLVKTLRGMGYKGPFLGSGGAYVVKEFYEATGEAGNGSFATAGWNWDLPYPGVKEFNEKYKAKYNEPFAPQEAGENYSIVYALKEALEIAGSTDPDAVRDALAKLDIDTVMTGGHLSFDETGLNKHSYPVLVEWIGGMPRTVYPKQDASVEPVFEFE